jgi:hypothetical protein
VQAIFPFEVGTIYKIGKKFLPKNHSENLLPSIGYSTTEKYLMSVHFRMAHSNLLLRYILYQFDLYENLTLL